MPPITIWCMLIVVMYGVCVLGTDQQSERRCRVHQRALHDRGGEEQSADQVCPDTRLFLIISLTVNVLMMNLNADVSAATGRSICTSRDTPET